MALCVFIPVYDGLNKSPFQFHTHFLSLLPTSLRLCGMKMKASFWKSVLTDYKGMLVL